MIGFACGNFSTKIKCCKRCKHYFLWGIGGGDCCRTKEYKSTNDSCKYYKRDNYFFYSDGRIKNKEEYDEWFS